LVVGSMNGAVLSTGVVWASAEKVVAIAAPVTPAPKRVIKLRRDIEFDSEFTFASPMPLVKCTKRTRGGFLPYVFTLKR
jgi:hypothetical protein